MKYLKYMSCNPWNTPSVNDINGIATRNNDCSSFDLNTLGFMFEVMNCAIVAMILF